MVVFADVFGEYYIFAIIMEDPFPTSVWSLLFKTLPVNMKIKKSWKRQNVSKIVGFTERTIISIYSSEVK